MNLTKDAVAERLGITFQQLYKYERGENRISSGRLKAMADILEVEMSYFFDEAPRFEPTPLDALLEQLATGMDDDARALNRMFLRIADARLRKAIVALIEAAADADCGPPAG